MDLLQLTVNGLFVLLLASILAWILIYRRLNPEDLPSSRYYRWHQLLIALIALLAILVALIIVLSSDPGSAPTIIFFWP